MRHTVEQIKKDSSFQLLDKLHYDDIVFKFLNKFIIYCIDLLLKLYRIHCFFLLCNVDKYIDHCTQQYDY